MRVKSYETNLNYDAGAGKTSENLDTEYIAMTTKVKIVEKRQFGRRQSFLHGWVKLPGRPAVTCTLRDISVGGAMLVFDSPQGLPYGFLLTIEGTGQVFGCEIRHHNGARVGVQFVDVATIGERGELDTGGRQAAYLPQQNSQHRH